MPDPSSALILLAAAMAASLASAAVAQSVTITHDQGETVIEGIPESVMVTDWAAFDNLSALGVTVVGVPSSAVPPYLAELVPANAAPIGSLQEPDVEGIVAAEPDLVVVASRSRESYPMLAEFVPTIDMSVDNLDLVEEVEANLAEYGAIFGLEERAAALAASLDAKVDEAREAAEGRGTGLVVVTNAGKLGLYGPASRVAWIYNTLGVPSVFDEVDDSDHGGDGISFEYLLEANPDWLFVVDRDAGVGEPAGAARALLDNELIHGTTFWQNDQVIYLDPAAAYVTMHGYNGLMLMLDQLIGGYAAAS